MIIRPMNIITDYDKVINLFSVEDRKRTAVLFNSSITLVVMVKNNLIGMATVRFINSFPVLQHLIIKSKSLISGKAFISLFNRVEKEIGKLGFDYFFVDIEIKEERKNVHKIVIRYFNIRIENVKQIGNNLFYLIRIKDENL